MAKKISEFSSSALPLSGNEIFILNQNGETFSTSLNNIKDYMGSNDVNASTKVRSSSANWDNSYTIVNANSATWDQSNPSRIIVTDFPGIDPTGESDSTAALQALVTDLGTDPMTREIYFPPGVYKFNILVPEQVRIVGSGCQITGGLSKVSNTIFMPWNDALPVLHVKSLFTNYFSDFELLGNGSGHASTGLGDSVAGLMVRANPQPDGVTYLYPGMGLVCERVKAARFDIGFHIHSPNSITFNDCSTVYNRIGWRGFGLSDTWMMNNCHGNYNEEEQLWVSFPRSVTIRGGDWGNCSSPLIKVDGGGVLIFDGANVESVSHTHIFEAVNSNLILRGNRIVPQDPGIAATTAVIVRQITNNAQVTFDNNRIEGFTTFGNSGKILLWESQDTTSPLPIVHGFAGALRYVTDSTYATTKRLLISESLESIRGPLRIELRDDFVGGGITTGAIGSLGWHLNNIAGAASLEVSATVAANEVGRLAINSSATANDGYWLTLPSGIQRTVSTGNLPWNSPWEMVWRILLVTNSGPNVRYGFLGGTPGSNPSDFIGFKFVAGTESNWKMVCRSGGTSTELDSGVAVGTGYVNLFIRGLANGFIGMRVGQTGNEQEISTNIPTGILVPGCSFFTQVAGARMQLIDLFSLTMNTVR